MFLMGKFKTTTFLDARIKVQYTHSMTTDKSITKGTTFVAGQKGIYYLVGDDLQHNDRSKNSKSYQPYMIPVQKEKASFTSELR
jgi:hypothetical protein